MTKNDKKNGKKLPEMTKKHRKITKNGPKSPTTNETHDTIHFYMFSIIEMAKNYQKTREMTTKKHKNMAKNRQNTIFQ